MAARARAAKSRLTSRHIVDAGLGFTLHLGVVESKRAIATRARDLSLIRAGGFRKQIGDPRRGAIL
jgi:hypothetical protein